jgi:uncharacterized protein
MTAAQPPAAGSIDYGLISVVPDPDTEQWWAATAAGRLLVRQCDACGFRFFPPSPTCIRCRSTSLGWFESGGRGVVYSYETVVQPTLAAFAAAVPYSTALVELEDCANDDGTPVRIFGTVLGERGAEDEIGIGAIVEVVFELMGPSGLMIPRFRVVETPAGTWRITGHAANGPAGTLPKRL